MITDNPVALRRDPFTRFNGPFLRKKGSYPIVAIVDYELRVWRENGFYTALSESPEDLVPLQVRPAARKWYTVLGTLSNGLTAMTERAHVDALVAALRNIARDPVSGRGALACEALPGPTPDDLDRAALARPKIAALVTWLTGKTRDIETHDTMYDDARADIYVGEILEILATLPKT